MRGKVNNNNHLIESEKRNRREKFRTTISELEERSRADEKSVRHNGP